jgi:hypothetical protein
MAKSEVVESYNAEDTQQDDLSAISEETVIDGPWVLQFRGGSKQSGVSDNGPWSMLSLFFVPVRPAGNQEITDEELEDLPSIRYRPFYTRNSDKRAFVKLMELFNVEPDPELKGDAQLKQMFSDAQGEELIANVKLGEDNRGDPEYKLTRFKVLED